MLAITIKICSSCLQIKSTDEFHKNPSQKDGLHNQCKECRSLYAKRIGPISPKTIKAKDGDKLCSHCLKVKPTSEFRLNKNTKDGYYSWCTECCNKNDLGRHLLYTYNMTQAQYDLILKSQNGVCAICGKTPKENGKALAVDHDHKTYKIRGILCGKCNVAIGMLNDDFELLEKATKYLKRGN